MNSINPLLSKSYFSLKVEIKTRSELITPFFDKKFLLMVGGAWFLQFSNKIDIRIAQ